MQKLTIHRNLTNGFSKVGIDLTYKQQNLKEFIQLDFSLENVKKQIDLKNQNYSTENRKTLAKVLSIPYETIELSEKQNSNLKNIAHENTFTITTGHQLCVLTGPLFFIYKILDTIKLSEILKKEYPEYNFVPVFWMASEDHDFEEINHVHLFNKKIEWKTKQTGPVGKFTLENFDEFKREIKALFSNQDSKQFEELLENFNGKNLSEATFNLVNFLFADHGLLILEPNNKELKSLFIPIFEKELKTGFSNECVLETNQKLEKAQIKAQVFSREINLFYLTENQRTRIVKNGTLFEIQNVGEFTLEQILAELNNFPERFSPNVIMRTLYQECILPNLLYIGGAGELAYWLQFKGVFDAVNVPYPLLKVRNSIQIIDTNSQKKLEKLNISLASIFEPIENLKNQFLEQNKSQNLNFENLKKQVENLNSALEKTILGYDLNLNSLLESEQTKLKNQIQQIESKLLKLEKNKFDTSLKQIEDVKSKLFPNNALQERFHNFLNFSKNGDYQDFLNLLYENISPLENDLILLRM